MSVTFKTTIFQAEGKNATGIEVPADLIAALGTSKRPALVVTVNDYVYRTTVGVYGDSFLLPFNAAHREASGLGAGDAVTVTLELDTAPRTVELPEDLSAALAAKTGAQAAFDALAPSKRKEFVRQVEEAKAPETRARRIAGIVAKLSEG
ncbi:MAG: YdeI/OmpD-associated family protein [Anaerolineae bacterium]|jgi:hypothetical protein|nr:YdeI/OmpD-associated family protein [Anaerolineae bacterium]